MSEQALYARLDGVMWQESGVDKTFGSRIYPIVLPDTVDYPAVTYQRVSADRYPAFGRDAVPVDPTIQVDVYASREAGYPAFRAAADAVTTALNRYKDMTATPPIYDTYIETEREDFEEEYNIYRRSMDVRMWYRSS